jgi:hypothetical protein
MLKQTACDMRNRTLSEIVAGLLKPAITFILPAFLFYRMHRNRKVNPKTEATLECRIVNSRAILIA